MDLLLFSSIAGPFPFGTQALARAPALRAPLLHPTRGARVGSGR